MLPNPVVAQAQKESSKTTMTYPSCQHCSHHLNKTIRKSVKCPLCYYPCCFSCIETHLVNSDYLPHCMCCHVHWNYDTLLNFADGDAERLSAINEHIKDLLFEAERQRISTCSQKLYLQRQIEKYYHLKSETAPEGRAEYRKIIDDLYELFHKTPDDDDEADDTLDKNSCYHVVVDAVELEAPTCCRQYHILPVLCCLRRDHGDNTVIEIAHHFDKLITHLTRSVLSAMSSRAVLSKKDTKELRIGYMMGNVTKEHFKQKLFALQIQKEREVCEYMVIYRFVSKIKELMMNGDFYANLSLMYQAKRDLAQYFFSKKSNEFRRLCLLLQN